MVLSYILESPVDVGLVLGDNCLVFGEFGFLRRQPGVVPVQGGNVIIQLLDPAMEERLLIRGTERCPSALSIYLLWLTERHACQDHLRSAV